MNKEELEKEAEFRTKGWKEQKNCIQAYLAGAEPREKQIGIDAKQIRALQKQNGKLTDKVKELEARIEKMKCCANCEYTPPFDKHCDNCIQGGIKFKYRNWKLRR